MTITDITVQSARLAAAEAQFCTTDFGYRNTAVEPWREDGAKLVRFVQAERNGQSSLLEYSVLFAPDSARVIRVGQQFNVYHGEGMKSGAIWTGTLEGSLRKFACC